MFGLEGDESAVSSNLRKSRDWFSKKSSSRIRSSIAGQYMLRRETTTVESGSNLSVPIASQTPVSRSNTANMTPFESEYIPKTNPIGLSEMQEKPK